MTYQKATGEPKPIEDHAKKAEPHPNALAPEPEVQWRYSKGMAHRWRAFRRKARGFFKRFPHRSALKPDC